MKAGLVLLAAIVAGCSSATNYPVRPDAPKQTRLVPQTKEERIGAAQYMRWQIGKCLVMPAGPMLNGAVTLQVLLTEKGNVRQILDKTPKPVSDPVLADAVKRAVLRCQPYHYVPRNEVTVTIQSLAMVE